jgi:hypothetical protein
MTTQATGFGNEVAYPDGGSHPTASNLNYQAGMNMANAAWPPTA